MEDGFRLQDARIAIVGLGLMGGSLALALRDECAVLYGVDANPNTVALALVRGIVDQADTTPTTLLKQADLVVLAIPVPGILSFIQDLPSLLQTRCIVFDLGSTKREIVHAMSALPENFDPIGGHPIAGKERLGLENADPNLYRDAPFVVSPLERTTPRAKAAARQIISSVCANLLEMTAEEHDRILASTSHLPFLLSSALALATPLECIPFVGPGFRSTSRLAGTPSHMTLGVMQTNRENILNAILTFRNSLDQIEAALRSQEDQQLESILQRSRSAYQLLISSL